MTKMAAMPTYDKNLKKSFFSRTTGPIALKIGMEHLGSQPIKVYINNVTGLMLTSFVGRSNLVP